MALDWTAASAQGGTAAQRAGMTVPFSAQADGHRPKARRRTIFQRLLSVWQVPDATPAQRRDAPAKVEQFHVESMKAPVDPRVG